MQIHNAVAVTAAIAQRHAELARILAATAAEDLEAASLLPDWDRLTVICHLRYGAEANLAMTRAVLHGQTASYYPEGRATQRPRSLQRRPGEEPRDVITSLVAASAELDDLWASLDEDQWQLAAHEPADNVDLGSTTLGFLALLRLTEVEVHGTDLDFGASNWSDVFVNTALPMRVHWLATRRSNHASADSEIYGTWILRPSDGTPFAINSTEGGVAITEDADVGDAEIAGSKRKLLSFLLGRTVLSELSVAGDREFASAFKGAFPSP